MGDDEVKDANILDYISKRDEHQWMTKEEILKIIDDYISRQKTVPSDVSKQRIEGAKRIRANILYRFRRIKKIKDSEKYYGNDIFKKLEKETYKEYGIPLKKKK